MGCRYGQSGLQNRLDIDLYNPQVKNIGHTDADQKSFCALGSVYYGDSPEFFEMAIVSVIEQTQPVPIFLVVDGPISKELNSVIKKYEAFLEQIIRLQSNIGLGLVLKTTLDELAARFEFVIRFDSDDINEKNRFKILIDTINSHEFDLVGSYINECEGDRLEIVKNTRMVPLEPVAIFNMMSVRNPFNHPSVAFRIEKARAVGSYEDVPFFEDWYLWARMVRSGAKVGNIPKPLVRFRFTDEMIKRRKGSLYIKHELAFYRRLWKLKSFGGATLLPIIALRIATRVLPIRLFASIYSWLRKISRNH